MAGRTRHREGRFGCQPFQVQLQVQRREAAVAVRLLSVQATGISLPSRSQRCNVLTGTPGSFAALPVLIVLSMSMMIHYPVLYGKLESVSITLRTTPDDIA
jgi:hypothetical protein